MRPATVTIKDGKPMFLFRKSQKLLIEEIADHWRETGRWWSNELPKDFFLVNTASGAFLLCRELKTDEWYVKPVQ